MWTDAGDKDITNFRNEEGGQSAIFFFWKINQSVLVGYRASSIEMSDIFREQ